jgi:cellulose synthase (UDP-forming)
MINAQADTEFLKTRNSKLFILLAFVLLLAYMIVISFFFHVNNRILFGILIATELFHFWQASGFMYTVWDMNYLPARTTAQPGVDVFITVAGEPVDIVRETVRAALAMDYPNFAVHILNDGVVAKKENWKDIVLLSEELGVHCITRTVPGGAKAGNINSGLRIVGNAKPFVAIFDADHAPHANFLSVIMSYVSDDRMAFVQTPQYYKNHGLNYVTGGAWEQQEIFFGAICKGKSRMNSAFMCGTNMVVRKSALREVGGMSEESIAEDFLTSLLIHAKGWKSAYIPQVLAEGLAPEDFLSYGKQQYRWARGSLEVIFKYNPLTMKGLSWKQRMQYLSSASFYLSGGVVLVNALFPLIFFFTGATAFNTSTMLLAAIFLPYMFAVLYLLSYAANYTYTYKAVAFSLGQFIIQIHAIFSAMFGFRQSFAVTAKRGVAGSNFQLVYGHIAYIVAAILGAAFAIHKYGLDASVANNIAWALIDCLIFGVFIAAAFPQSASTETEDTKPTTAKKLAPDPHATI